MPRLLVSTEELSALGTRLSSNASNQISDLQRVANEADPAGLWDGPASTTYQESLQKLKTSLQSAMEALGEVGTYVNKASEAYAAADAGALQALSL